MATVKNNEFIPSSYPPLPDDLSSVVELETVSLSKLESGDETERDRLFEICKERGFFYLDFTGTSVASLPEDSEEIARISEQVFGLSMEEKRKYLPDPPRNILFGYKHAGRTVTDSKGTPDTAEFFNVSKNDMLRSHPNLPWPSPILTHKPFLSQYVTAAHKTGLSILSLLAQKINLPPDSFSNLHRLHEQSGDHIRMTRGPARKDPRLPEIQTPGHTDFGTITILFNWLGGLQIWSESNRGQGGFKNVVDPPNSSANSETDNDEYVSGGSGHASPTAPKPKWLWVRPKPGLAIVNLGDAAVKFTNGLLCSGRHRVVPAPGEQGTYPRYSVVYFVRPEDKAVLKAFESEGYIERPLHEEKVLAKDWIAAQAKGLETGK